MVELTREEQERWDQRMKERAERKERETAEAAKQSHEQAKKADEKGAFRSRIGKGFAKVLSKTADTAENLRGKADFVGGEAGRIKKAITPPKRPAKLKQVKRVKAYKPKRMRPVYQQRAPRSRTIAGPDPFDSLLHGQRSHGNNSFDDMLYGKSKGKRGRGGDPFKGLI